MKVKKTKSLKKKSGKGFTLIELLAVIVVLAIIAVIAIPIILNVIEDSRRGAWIDSAYGIMESGNVYLSNQMIEDGEDMGSLDLILPDDNKLQYRGDKPDYGQLIITIDGKIAIVAVKGKYCAVKQFDEEKVRIVSPSSDDCYIASRNGVIDIVLNPGTPNGNNGWYITDVIAGVTANDSYVSYEYSVSIDGGVTFPPLETNEMDDTFTITENSPSIIIKVIGKDKDGASSGEITKEIKIDKTKPTNPIGNSNLNGTDLTVTGSGSTDTGSGLDGYMFMYTETNTPPAVPGSGWTDVTTGNHKFTIPSTCGKTYYVWGVAIDKAGNYSDVVALGNVSTAVCCTPPTLNTVCTTAGQKNVCNGVTRTCTATVTSYKNPHWVWRAGSGPQTPQTSCATGTCTQRGGTNFVCTLSTSNYNGKWWEQTSFKRGEVFQSGGLPEGTSNAWSPYVKSVTNAYTLYGMYTESVYSAYAKHYADCVADPVYTNYWK